MNKFRIAVDMVLKHEGGYVDDPSDPGGRTKYGISQRSYQGLDIRSITKDDAREIYKRDYWDRIRGDDLPTPVAIVAFDMAVNAGSRTASKMVQRAVKADQDGVIGPATLRAVSRRDATDVAYDVTLYRLSYYARLVTRRSSFGKYLKGWTKRTLTTLRIATENSN